MKFIKKHINEGYFGKVTDPKTSNSTSVSKIGLDALNVKAAEVKELLYDALYNTFKKASKSGDQEDIYTDNGASIIEVPFIIPNLIDKETRKLRSPGELTDTYDDLYPSPIKSLKWIPGEGYVAEVIVTDFRDLYNDPANRIFVFGKGIEIFVDKLDSIERTIERKIGTPLTIKLIRIEQTSSHYRASVIYDSMTEDDELIFPKFISQAIITDRVDFEKLYVLFSKFNTLSGEVIMDKVIICGDAIHSLNDLPPLPFKTHEIVFSGWPFIAECNIAPALTEIGNPRRLLDGKNYFKGHGSAFASNSVNFGSDISHPCITFSLDTERGYKGEELEKLTDGAITTKDVDTYLKNKRGSKVYISYNPYTKLIEKR